MRRLSLLLGALLMTGCSAAFGGGSDVGSLGSYQPDAHQCTPLRHSTWLIEGSNSLYNDGDNSVVITKVELVDEKGLAMTSARLAPLRWRGRTSWLQGVEPGYRLHSPFVRWAVSRSVPAIGASIKPGQERNLLLYLTAPHGGAMQPPKVTYLEKGHVRVWTGGETLTVPAGAKCPKDWEEWP
jgi:predicted small secreted protein